MLEGPLRMSVSTWIRAGRSGSRKALGSDPSCPAAGARAGAMRMGKGAEALKDFTGTGGGPAAHCRREARERQ